jgi:hypothetical protein
VALGGAMEEGRGGGSVAGTELTRTEMGGAGTREQGRQKGRLAGGLACRMGSSWRWEGRV